MAKAIDINVKGIKCDAPTCGYRDMSATFDTYQEYLNKPCPQCGAPLLTEKDMKATRAHFAIVDWLNALWGDVKVRKNAKRKTIGILMNGTGKIRYKILK